MPLYIGDYLGDTQRLTTEQHGAYFLMILDYWRNGPPPDDDAVLRLITRLDVAAWRKHRPVIERLFKVTDGVWRHKRIEEEIVAAQFNQERRSSKAQAAANARWGNAESNARSMPEETLEECAPPSPSPEPNGSSSEAKASSPRERPQRAPQPSDVSTGVWRDFQAIRKQKRAPLTDTALGQIRKQADEVGWSLERALTECCARGWQGFNAEWITKDNRNGRYSGNGTGAGGTGNGLVDACIEDMHRANAERDGSFGG